MTRLVLYSMVAIGGLFTACTPEDPLPAYVRIEQPRLVLPSGDTVSGLGIVPDVWMFQNSKTIGTFEAPTVIPVFPSDGDNFLLFGGVWVNGTTQVHRQYPMWEAWSQTVSLQERDTAVLTPVFRYRVDTVAISYWEETFNTGTGTGELLLEAPEGFDLDSMAQMTYTTDNPLEGDRCLRVHLTTERNFLRVHHKPTTDDQRRFPDGKPLWAEVSYRGNVKFGFALLYYEPRGDGTFIERLVPNGYILPEPPVTENEWQTIYFDLRPLVATAYAGSEHSLVLVSLLPSDRTESTFYLDNLRVWTQPF